MSTLKKAFIISLTIMSLPLCHINAQDGLRHFDEGKDLNTVKTDYYGAEDDNSFAIHPAYNLGWGFLSGSGNPYVYDVSMGANFEFIRNLYAGAQIGYLGAFNSYSESGISIYTKSHFITIPLEFGYTLLNNSRKFGVVPFIGVGFNVSLGGSVELTRGGNSYEEEYDGGDFAVDGRVGLKLHIYGLAIAGTYHFPFNDDQKDFFGEDGYPEVSLSWSF